MLWTSVVLLLVLRWAIFFSEGGEEARSPMAESTLVSGMDISVAMMGLVMAVRRAWSEYWLSVKLEV